ncbi:hypothetical protein DL96DRAFT_271672 [Flagelloscypha sp. PMI_526]|nr:hypothetical protein DL96DRAFT_271672 [Flagelloscypha sp. PMI_526]
MPYKIANASPSDTDSIAESVPESSITVESAESSGKKTDSSGSTIRNERRSMDTESHRTAHSQPRSPSPTPSRPSMTGSRSNFSPSSPSSLRHESHSNNPFIQPDESHLALPRHSLGRRSIDSLASSTFSVDTWKSGSSYGMDSNLYSEQTNTSTSIAQREEVNQQLGEDGQKHNIEIDGLPCAGIRIPHGRLKGLFAWKLCVQCPSTTIPNNNPKVMAHFILDMGCRHSPVSQEILRALGFKGDLTPGSTIQLLVQGVKATCCVAFPGEASRMGSNFIIEGDLTMYFDSRLGAPVFYVDDEMKKPALDRIAQTIAKRRKTFRDKVRSVVSVISGGSSSP